MGERGNEGFDDGFSCKDPQKVADRIKEMLKDKKLSQDEITELNAVAEKLASTRQDVIVQTVKELQTFLASDTILSGTEVDELRKKLNGNVLSRDIVLDRPPQAATADTTPVLATTPTENLSKLESGKIRIIEALKDILLDVKLNQVV